jgi:signal transduction histidine kinase
MRRIDEASELWMIGYKAIMLVYAVYLSLTSGTELTPLYVLFLLLYLSANLMYDLIKHDGRRPAAAALSIGIAAAMAPADDRLLILLLPMHLYELSALFAGRRRIAAAILLLIPLAVLPMHEVPLYLFLAAVTLLLGSMHDALGSRLRVQRDTLELTRSERDRLQERLLENDELLRQTAYTLKLEERSRLSQDIHDNIGHAMTGALIQTEAAKRLLRHDPDKAAELLDNAIRISKEGIESIRSDLKRMKPPTEQMGINRMKLLLDDFSAQHPIRTAFSYEGDMDAILPLHWRIIQENAREALTNMMKYAQATAVSVHIQVLPAWIKATISDNGQGQARIVKGLGIIGMEERAAAVNGKLIVDGSRGFTVTTLIPHGS